MPEARFEQENGVVPQKIPPRDRRKAGLPGMLVGGSMIVGVLSEASGNPAFLSLASLGRSS